MKKRFAVIILLVVACSLPAALYAMSLFKPPPPDNSQNNPMHFEFEQSPEQTFSLNCNWYPACPAHPSEPCIWVQGLNQEGVNHV